MCSLSQNKKTYISKHAKMWRMCLEASYSSWNTKAILQTVFLTEGTNKKCCVRCFSRGCHQKTLLVTRTQSKKHFCVNWVFWVKSIYGLELITRFVSGSCRHCGSWGNVEIFLSLGKFTLSTWSIYKKGQFATLTTFFDWTTVMNHWPARLRLKHAIIWTHCTYHILNIMQVIYLLSWTKYTTHGLESKFGDPQFNFLNILRIIYFTK